MILSGVLVGSLLSLATATWMRSMLFGVAPIDFLSYATAILLLVLVASAACYLPARRASSIDPVIALRND
jgi:ABC-type antimicrobial peptide transport system permease subunit